MTEETQAAAGQQEHQFSIQRVYLKDLSLETPLGTDGFLIKQQPAIQQDLATEVNKLGDDAYEVILKLTITAKIEEKTLFLIEIHQAGIFLIKGLEGGQLAQALNTVCPSIIFPYARETIDSSLLKASLPPLMLPPMNFDAVYAQAREEQKSPAH